MTAASTTPETTVNYPKYLIHLFVNRMDLRYSVIDKKN